MPRTEIAIVSSLFEYRRSTPCKEDKPEIRDPQRYSLFWLDRQQSCLYQIVKLTLFYQIGDFGMNIQTEICRNIYIKQVPDSRICHV